MMTRSERLAIEGRTDTVSYGVLVLANRDMVLSNPNWIYDCTDVEYNVDIYTDIRTEISVAVECNNKTQLLFRATIESWTETSIGKISVVKTIEHENPTILLEGIQWTNGTRIKTPTTEELLTHLFVKRTPYAYGNYIITTFII